MRLPESITENLHFLTIEVDAQVRHLQSYLSSPSTVAARRIVDRRGYAGNLKTSIHNACLEQLALCREGEADALTLKGIESVATNLEQIAGLCRDCIKQMNLVGDVASIGTKVYTPMLKRVRRGIELIEPAVSDSDTRMAVKISQIEDRLDRDFDALVKRYAEALKQCRDTEDLVRALFVAHGIDQMGDALLDISEAIISANLGQPVDIDRYHSLQASVGGLQRKGSMNDLQIESIAETRSGSAIAAIGNGAGKKKGYVAVFKDGEKRKLKEEREGVESWHEIYPGLAPRILAYKKNGQSASLLIEHLPGLTFEQIVLNESPALLKETLARLGGTLESVWRETRTKRRVSADFMQQLRARVDEVYRIHPEFRHGDRAICGAKVSSLNGLIAAAAEREAGLKAPFSVYIHGDFNLDNIIYDPLEKRVHFIDLHRSRYMDYVQDVSVFMVSNYRLQILDAAQRRRILKLAIDFYRMSRRFARDVGDDTFDARLALGLARSFVTSTRFILDKSLARRMLLRARFLMEQLLAVPRDEESRYRLPVQELFIG